MAATNATEPRAAAARATGACARALSAAMGQRKPMPLRNFNELTASTTALALRASLSSALDLVSRDPGLAQNCADRVPLGIYRMRVATLVGDIVSYSRLMEEDGLGTVTQILVMEQAVLMPLARRHKALMCRSFGGDGLLMGFAGATAAARCAIELHRRLAMLCEEVPAHRRIRLRLGLSYGLGYMVDGEIFGTPVNVAARLQAMTEPESTYVSGDFALAVKRSIYLRLKAVGEHYLKNITGAVKVYQLLDDDGLQLGTPSEGT
jgi:class 3 adenylate cyclase